MPATVRNAENRYKLLYLWHVFYGRYTINSLNFTTFNGDIMDLLFFKTRHRHRVFDYKPLYYNKEKEELDRQIRYAELKYKKAAENGEYVSSIKGSMKHYIEAKRKHSRVSNLRLFIILVFLAGLTYIILFKLLNV